MARFDEIYEKYKKKQQNGTGFSGAVTSASGVGTVAAEKNEPHGGYKATGRFAGILANYQKNGTSFSGVDDSYVQSFFKDAQAYTKKAAEESRNIDWALATDKAKNEERNQALTDLGNRAKAVKVYLTSNKKSIDPSAYEEYMRFLKNFENDKQSIYDTFLGNTNYYSQWDTQEEYDFHEAHSTPEKRREWYAGLEKRKKELEAQKEQETAAWQETEANANSYDGFEYSEMEEAHWNKLKAIEEEINKIGTEMRQYERGGYNEKGQHYGSKRADDALALTMEKDFATLSQQRDHKNPTRQQLDEADSMNNSVNWDYDEMGVLRDAYGNAITTDETGKRVSTKAQEYAVKDKLGVYLSATDKEKEEYMGTIVNGTWGEIIGEGMEGSWDQLNDNEIGVYYYLLNKDGVAAAEKFLKEMTPELNRRAAEKARQAQLEMYNESGLGGKLLLNAATVPANLLGGITGLAQDAAHLIRGEETNPYSSAHSFNAFGNTIRSETAKELEELMPGVKIPLLNFTVGDLYQTIMSRADSLAAMGIGGSLGGVLLATNAAANEMTRLYEQGASVKQMAWGAAAVGAAELVFETLSIENLKGIKDAKKRFGRIKSALVQGEIEASEEGLTEIANIISNAVVMGKESDWNKLVAENDGDELAAFLEKVRDVAKASFGGFLSGAPAGALASPGKQNQQQTQEKTGEGMTLEKQPENRLEEVGLPLQDPKQAEEELKKQRFAVDITRYSPKQRATVEAAMRSGVLNNTKKTHEFVDMVAQIAEDKGVAFNFADNKKLQEMGYYLPDVTVNGVTTGQGIVLNMNSGKLLNRVVGHEITHVLEGSPELYNAMADSILKYAKTKGEYDSRLAQIAKLYEGREGYTGTDANSKIQKELVAELVGDYLFSDEGFVKKLSVENRNLFQKIWDEVKYLCRVVTAGSKEARQLATLEKRFAELYRAETKNPTGDGGVRYSLNAFEDGKRFVDVQMDPHVFDGMTVADMNRAAKSILMKKFAGKVIGLDNQAFVNGDSVNEYLHPSKAIEGDVRKAKLTAAGELDNLLDAGEALPNEPDGRDGHVHPDAIDFSYYKTIFKVGNEYFEGIVNIKNIKRGKLLKDVTKIRNITKDIVSSYGANPKSNFLRDASMDSIRDPEGKVNRKNSLSEKVAEDIAPLPWEIRGEDVSIGGVAWPTREDIDRMKAGESTQQAQAVPDSQERVQRAEEILGGKDSFLSKNAAALYEELSVLKKGVKASNRLGYILDHGYDWRSIKTALLNIRDNPNEVVNPNSQAEALIREMLGREYDDTVEDLSRPDEVTNQYAEKLWSIKTEIANNERLREEAMADYQEEIDRLQELYDGKANKTTKAANDLLRRIERVRGMKSRVDSDYARRIERLQERVDKMDTDVYRRARQRRSKQAQYESEMAELIGDISTWKDKKLGISYWINTLRRNLRDVVRDKKGNRDIAKADAIYEELQGKYNHNEAELKRESTKIKEAYAALQITKAEDAYIQMLGELRHNPSTELSLETVEEFYEKHKKHIDKEKVDKVIEMARKTYDELLVRLNKRLREQGMKEIPYRKGYFPHFTEDKQGPLGKILNWKTKNDDIPTDIAGLTEAYNPERSWQSFNKERTGDTTTYSFLQGMDNYVQGALDWIYHIEDIQKRRALENHIRYVHSKEGVKARIDEIRANEEYDADEAQQQIDMALAEYRNKLGNFVQDLRTGTNILAGKKNSLDRGMESATNRKIYSVMTNLSNRVSANQVAGSISSALTNFIPITQSWGEVSPIYSANGMMQAMANAVRDDGMIDKSDFLTNRLRNPESLYKGTWDKISDKVSWLMEGVDSLTSQTVWRSKYMQNIAAGMSEEEAIKDADQFAENVLAGRSRGNMPTAFNAKNPIAKIATAFQLEVANQYGYILKDMPQDMKKKATARLVGGYATMFFGAYVYNALFSAMTGRDAALDPIGIIEQLIRGLSDEEEEPEDAVMDFFENVLQEVPFIGGLAGGGRVPLSSAMPYDGNILDAAEGITKAFTEPDWKNVFRSIWEGNWEGVKKESQEGDWMSLLDELSNPLYYLVSPIGGGQLRKTFQGSIGLYAGKEHPGSYTEDGELRYTVGTDPLSVLQNVLFGRWSGQEAQQYLDEGRRPLTEKQTREFFESGMTIQQYWDYRDELGKLKKQDEKLALINGLDLSDEQKRVLKSYLLDEEGYAEDNPEKYAFLEEEGIGYLGWKELPEDEQEAWNWAFDNQGKAVMGDVFEGGVVEYRKYTKAMSEMKADKDKDGKDVAGSRKKKVTDYINGLDLDYGEKIILYVAEYNSKASRDAYGYEIVDYLNGRSDMELTQIYGILKSLGFKVGADGSVTWD